MWVIPHKIWAKITRNIGWTFILIRPWIYIECLVLLLCILWMNLVELSSPKVVLTFAVLAIIRLSLILLDIRLIKHGIVLIFCISCVCAVPILKDIVCPFQFRERNKVFSFLVLWDNVLLLKLFSFGRLILCPVL